MKETGAKSLISQWQHVCQREHVRCKLSILTPAATGVLLAEAVEGEFAAVTALPLHVLLAHTAARRGVTEAVIQGAHGVTITG